MNDLEQRNTHFLSIVQKTYPKFIYKSSSRFSYHPPRTISYVLSDPNFSLLLLHELGHATIGKNNYSTDIERLKIECLAWDKAKSLAIKFNLDFDTELAESELDSYRNWLHAKSLCKKCGLTRFQSADGHYHCPKCDPL